MAGLQGFFFAAHKKVHWIQGKTMKISAFHQANMIADTFLTEVREVQDTVYQLYEQQICGECDEDTDIPME